MVSIFQPVHFSLLIAAATFMPFTHRCLDCITLRSGSQTSRASAHRATHRAGRRSRAALLRRGDHGQALRLIMTRRISGVRFKSCPLRTTDTQVSDQGNASFTIAVCIRVHFRTGDRGAFAARASSPLWSSPSRALYMVASALTLLIVGIHNPWDCWGVDAVPRVAGTSASGRIGAQAGSTGRRTRSERPLLVHARRC
jgi:hypothetical protein